MFLKNLKNQWLSGLMVLCLISIGTIDSQAQVVYSASRHMTRSQVWLSFTNSGTSSMHYQVTPSRVMMRMSYPGDLYSLYALLGTEEFVEYWGDKAWGSSQQKAFTNMHSAGEGVLVLTNVGGEKYVSVTGPRTPTEDVIPMNYDIANSKEASWGIQSIVPNRGVGPGTVKSNWWQGATPQSADPANLRPYEIHNFDYGIYPPVQNAGEEIHITQWQTQHNIVVTRKAHAWSHQDLDDFFIIELEFENRGGQQLDDTYLGVMNSMYVNNAGTAYRWGHEGGLITYRRSQALDDHYRYSEAPNFANNSLSGLSPADFQGKYIMYQWDGNSPSSFEEDTGDPYFSDVEVTAFPGSKSRPEGMPIAPAYQFMAPLAFRNAGSHMFNAADAAEGFVDPQGEPLSHWYEVFGRRNIDDPTRGALSMAAQYDFFTSPTMDNPPSEQMQWEDMIFGPYSLSPGQKAKIVLAYGFGSAAEFDINSQTGYANDITRWSWNVGDVGPDARKSLLAKGEEAMLQHLSHAQFAYDNEYQIPNAPPDVDFFQGSNAQAKITLTWSDAAEKAINPEYGQADVTGYRIYRSIWQETGPWELVGEVSAGSSQGGTYTWVDENSLAGFQFAYNVRSVASPKSSWAEGSKTHADLPETIRKHLMENGLESGWSAAEQRMIVPGSPILAANDAADNLETPVVVVPNPFSLAQAQSNYQGTLKLRFVGVPHQAKISIFTVSGDLVAEINHNDPTAGEAQWLLKDRFLTGEATSSAYFFVVESLVPSSRGRKTKGAFIINR